MLTYILKLHPAMLAAVRGAPQNRENEDVDATASPERGKGPTPADVKKLWKNPWLIPDERLVREVVACIDADEAYSPLAERVRQYVSQFPRSRFTWL